MTLKPARQRQPTDTDQRWRRAQRAGQRWALWGSAMGLLLGLVVAAPAQWLASALNQASGGRLLLAQARGSLWTGSALLVLTGGPGSRDAATLPDRLHWKLRLGWQGLRLQLEQACCMAGPVVLQLHPHGLGLKLALHSTSTQAGTHQALAHWPAAWLAGLGTPWNTLQLGGSLQLGGQGLSAYSQGGAWRLDGTVALDLLDISSRLSPLPALGSYRIELLGGGASADAVQLQLRTLAGALNLTGSGQFTAKGLHFRGNAQAAPGQEAALANLLNIIGRRQGALSVISIG